MDADKFAEFSSKSWFKVPKKSKSQGNDTKPSFQLYFINEKDMDVDQIVKDVGVCEKYIEQYSAHFSMPEIKTNRIFFIDFKQALKDDLLKRDWPEFETKIVCDTKYCLSCFGLAMYQKVVEGNPIIKRDFPVINARITNHQPLLSLKNLKVHCVGNLVSVRGTVIKANASRLRYKYILFSCRICTGQQVVTQTDGIFTVPTKCPTKGCRAQSRFIAHLNKSGRVDWQTITLQEISGINYTETGHVARIAECELTEDLVGCCFPGDDVTVTGVAKVQNSKEIQSKKNQPSIFSFYLDAVSVVNNKSQGEVLNSSLGGITFNDRDYYAIQKIHAEPSLFRFLVQSLCPKIYGNEIVKAGLLLTLFGGTCNVKGDITTRFASHVLMVGDPGLGKSQLLQSCANVAPRGVYVCGNSSTSAGLTVMITKDAWGDYSLEAGALLLANRGICCIDEFDKMKNQHSSLLETMEQQTISIAKAGVTCSLSASVSILSAANPAEGHYNKAKTVSENLKLSAPLISRFDLLFILLDQPCQNFDALISKHILGLHQGIKNDSLLDTSIIMPATQSSSDILANRLKLRPGETLDYLPHPLFRKYIAYAQKYVHPILSPEAKTLIKHFYLKLRKNCSLSYNCLPITARQLESLLRLTQARAKVELREEATEGDAADVIEIMRHSFVDALSDENGTVDLNRSQNGSGISKQSAVKKILASLHESAEVQKKSTFTLQEIKTIMGDIGLAKHNFQETLEKLNFHGYIIKKSARTYELASVDYA